MPSKPTKEVIDAYKKELNPKDVLRVIINETPELKNALLSKGLVKEVNNGGSEN